MGKRKKTEEEEILSVEECVRQINGRLSSATESIERQLLLSVAKFNTPIGDLFILANETELIWMEFISSDLPKNAANFLKSHKSVIMEASLGKEKKDDKVKEHKYSLRLHLNNSPPILSLIAELTLYFSGTLQAFKTPLLLETGTRFQTQVWSSLTKIPYGHKVSYSQLSKNANVEGAHRAAANAVGANRFVIVVPCHRVIREGGGLGGFAGGIHRKIWLQQHEDKNSLSTTESN